MIGIDKATGLLAAAERNDVPAARFEIVRVLLRLDLEPDAWAALGRRVLALLDVAPGEPGRADALALMAQLPVSSAHERLSRIANDPADPDHELAQQLTETDAARVARLVRELGTGGGAEVARALALHEIERYDVDPAVFDTALDSGDVDRVFWASLAVGRLGRLEPVGDLLRRLETDPPSFMDGSQWVAYDMIAPIRPVPDALHACLVAAEREEMGRDPLILIWAATGTKDAEGSPLTQGSVAAPTSQPEPSPVQRMLRDALAIAEEIRGDDGAARVLRGLDRQELDLLAAVPADIAADVVATVIERIAGLADPMQATNAGNNLVVIAGACDLRALDVDRVLDAQAAAAGRLPRDQLAYVLARAPRERVVGTLARRLSRAESVAAGEIGEILELVYTASDDAAPPVHGAGPTRGKHAAARARSARLVVAFVKDVAPGDVAPAPRTAYPRIDCDDVVVIDAPFPVTIGLSGRRDRDMISTGPLELTGTVELELRISHDPESLRLDGPAVHSLVSSEADPYPSVDVMFTALDGDDLAAERRIGVHYMIDGTIVAVAWRIVVAVHDERDVPFAAKPDVRDRELVELGPLLREHAPDLVLVVFRADSAGADRFVWAAYPATPGIPVPDAKRSMRLGDDVRDFATSTRRTVPQKGSTDATYLWLAGLAKNIGRVVPEGIRSVIRAVADRSETPARVLLLTEELHVPWEIMALDPPLVTRAGGASPFLGAHVAIGRWLLSETKPRPVPLRRATANSHAVLTAKYEGVPRWPRLPHAEAEALALEQAYPPAHAVPPIFSEVIRCLRGDPPADVLHVALHGQFDAHGTDEGLVLLASAQNGFTPQYLQAQHIDGITLADRPFIFLNACQVGAAKEVLGDYGGLAGAFMRAGAAGVVAPLWNVHDETASQVASFFYRSVYSAEAPPVAEVLRRIRATYTEAAVVQGTPDVETGILPGPSALAYQFFGHPRLQLMREQAATPVAERGNV